jgi:hypothetical protein
MNSGCRLIRSLLLIPEGVGNKSLKCVIKIPKNFYRRNNDAFLVRTAALVEIGLPAKSDKIQSQRDELEKFFSPGAVRRKGFELARVIPIATAQGKRGH